MLLAVERGTAHSDDQLRSPRVEVLSREDRNLTTELVRGTLRWQIVLDREIAARLRNPEADMHFGVIIALRLGAYQVLFLDRVPPHAAVHQSVELAKQADGPAAAGLVNAVLRRLVRECGRMGNLRGDPAAAYPEWMVRRWRARYGDASAQKICAFGQQPPPTAVRLEQQRIEASDTNLAPGAFLTHAARLPAGGTTSLRVQDEASQLVAELAAFRAGDALLDACAAPGGKTAILLERNPNAAIHAIDVNPARLRMTARRFPWPPHVRFTVADAAGLPPGPEYATALCDMPCSGTGTLARNPEIRHRLTESGIEPQAARQRAILASVLGTMRPGSRIVYSTCSLEREENEDVVEAVLAAHPHARIEPIAPVLDAMQAEGVLTAEGHALLRETALDGPCLRTLPGVHPCDGFFATLLTTPT